MVRIDSDEDSVAKAVAGLFGDALAKSGEHDLIAAVTGWPPPAYCGPYLLTQWTDETHHADLCDCDDDNEGVGPRCMENSEWQYAVCTVEGEWTPLFEKLPRHPERGRAPELLRELTALSEQVVDAAKRCVERRLASRTPCEARVRRARAEVLEEAYNELHAAVSALWEAEGE